MIVIYFCVSGKSGKFVFELIMRMTIVFISTPLSTSGIFGEQIIFAKFNVLQQVTEVSFFIMPLYIMLMPSAFINSDIYHIKLAFVLRSII